MKTVCLFTHEPVLGYGVDSMLKLSGAWNSTAFADPAEFIAKLKTPGADLAVIDLDSADFDLVLLVRRSVPECRLVLWIHSIMIETAFQAIHLGVLGILSKNDGLESLLQCFNTVATGRPWLDSALASGVESSERVRLTPRQSELVSMVADGLKNKEIAEALRISDVTVRVYMTGLFRKLGVKDRYELALYGLRNNMASNRTLMGPALAQVSGARPLIVSRPLRAERDQTSKIENHVAASENL